MEPRTLGGSRAGLALLVVLLGLGTWLRVTGIASHPLWVDEYGTWWAVAGEGWADLWQRVLAIHGQSPFYYAIVRLSVEALGPGALALRLPSLVFGLALLCASYPLARSLLRGRRAALAAVAAFALSERLVYYAQEARPYSLALLCAVLSFLAYQRLRERPQDARLRGAWLLATAATVYAHYLFGVAMIVQALHRWIWPPVHESRRAWLVDHVLLGGLLAPGALQLAELFLRREVLDWVETPGALEAARLLVAHVDPWLLGASGLATGIAVAATRGVPGGARSPAARDTLGLIGLWIALPFLLIAALPPLFGITLLHTRYLMLGLPAVCLAYAALLALPPAGSRWCWLPLAVFAATALGLRAPHLEATGLYAQRFDGENWARASDALAGRHQPDEPIFYATHLVELDAVALGRGTPAQRDFTTWPVAAHLGEAARAALRPLPYRDTPDTRGALRARLEEAAATDRSWVIGTRNVVEPFLRSARAHPGVRVSGSGRYGRVWLFQLRGAPPPGGAPPGRS